MATEKTELEGFICPICFKDLGSMYHLHGHFETDHPDEDTAIVDQIKGLFGKAKKFLSKEEQSQNPFQQSSLSQQFSKLPKETVYWEPQEIGPIRSYTDYFKGVRERRVDRFMRDTNILLNRLDKLLNIDPVIDGKKRKEVEKSLVAWASDKHTKICMTCGNSFNFSRRRHHCRLCGCVLCHCCSHFLSHDYARKLTNPSFSFSGLPFKSSGSQNSLNSFADNEGRLHLRICSECRFLLERREEQLESRSNKRPLVLLYESLRGYMDEADQLIPVYCKMTESLSEGQSAYSLSEATEMRNQLMKLCQCIAAYVKTLAQEKSDGEGKLRSMLSQQVGLYVQEKLVSLPRLPSEVEMVGMRERRRREAEERIAEERRVEEVWRDKYEGKMKNLESGGSSGKETYGHLANDSSSDNFSSFSNRSTAPEGWLPTSSTNTNPFEDDSSDHPLLQQISNIKRYITQARKEQRWDELAMLQQNLSQLQEEYNNNHLNNHFDNNHNDNNHHHYNNTNNNRSHTKNT